MWRPPMVFDIATETYQHCKICTSWKCTIADAVDQIVPIRKRVIERGRPKGTVYVKV
jgi:hypothetical protein